MGRSSAQSTALGHAVICLVARFRVCVGSCVWASSLVGHAKLPPRYRNKHIGAMPPHPYAIADTAYRALIREEKNQGLLISGESGAGKTDRSLVLMHFFAELITI